MTPAKNCVSSQHTQRRECPLNKGKQLACFFLLLQTLAKLNLFDIFYLVKTAVVPPSHLDILCAFPRYLQRATSKIMEISLRTKNCSNFQEKILVGVTLKLRFSDLAIDDENENVRM